MEDSHIGEIRTSSKCFLLLCLRLVSYPLNNNDFSWLFQYVGLKGNRRYMSFHCNINFDLKVLKRN